MKKLFLLLVMGAMCLTLTGCGNKNVEGTLEDLKEDEKPMMLTNTKVDSETVEYFLGTTDIEYEEALASEPAVSSIAHSVVLVRTKENADVEAIKTKIKDSINPRKWLCAGVEKDDVIVESKGNLIILIMVEHEDTREKLEEAFDNL